MRVSSRFRYVEAKVAESAKSYQNVSMLSSAMDSNPLAANSQFVAVSWETRGGGAFVVLPNQGSGRLSNVALFSGHKSAVHGIAFNPFDDCLIASASEDTTICLWEVETEDEKVCPPASPCEVLNGHTKGVKKVEFSPVVDNCLASYSNDGSVKIWDISSGSLVYSHSPSDKSTISDIAWSQGGDKICLATKEGNFFCFDPRSEECTPLCSHPVANKSTKCCYYDKLNMLVTTCFVTPKQAIVLWDQRSPEEPLSVVPVEESSVSTPFIDHDLGILYVFARGSSTIRCFELQSEENPLVELASSSTRSQVSAFAMAPKYCVDAASCEVDRFYVVTADKDLLSVKMTIPRRNNDYTSGEGLYPPTNAPQPSCDFEAWLNNEEFEPIKIDFICEPEAAIPRLPSRNNGRAASRRADSGDSTKGTGSIGIRSYNPARMMENLEKEIGDLRGALDSVCARVAELESEVEILKNRE